MQLTHKLVLEAIQFGIDGGLRRGHSVACAFADPSGRSIGVVRHEDAQWIAPQFALGKATLATAYRTRTQPFFERLQKERPLYGATVAAMSTTNQWMLAEGGAAIMVPIGGKEKCIGAVGIAGCFPATVDQEIADEVVAWVKNALAKVT